jgi:CRP-like cAMP-binding protein
MLEHLSEEEVGRLADALLHVSVRAGEPVVAQGDASSGRCFLIEQGLLRVSRAGEGGEEEEAYTLGPGDCYGGEALALEEAEGAVQPVSVVALEDARLLVMDRATALRLVFTGGGGGQGGGGVEGQEEGGS